MQGYNNNAELSEELVSAYKTGEDEMGSLTCKDNLSTLVASEILPVLSGEKSFLTEVIFLLKKSAKPMEGVDTVGKVVVTVPLAR